MNEIFDKDKILIVQKISNNKKKVDDKLNEERNKQKVVKTNKSKVTTNLESTQKNVTDFNIEYGKLDNEHDSINKRIHDLDKGGELGIANDNVKKLENELHNLELEKSNNETYKKKQDDLLNTTKSNSSNVVKTFNDIQSIFDNNKIFKITDDGNIIHIFTDDNKNIYKFFNLENPTNTIKSKHVTDMGEFIKIYNNKEPYYTLKIDEYTTYIRDINKKKLNDLVNNVTTKFSEFDNILKDKQDKYSELNTRATKSLNDRHDNMIEKNKLEISILNHADFFPKYSESLNKVNVLNRQLEETNSQIVSYDNIIKDRQSLVEKLNKEREEIEERHKRFLEYNKPKT